MAFEAILGELEFEAWVLDGDQGDSEAVRTEVRETHGDTGRGEPTLAQIHRPAVV